MRFGLMAALAASILALPVVAQTTGAIPLAPAADAELAPPQEVPELVTEPAMDLAQNQSALDEIERSIVLSRERVEELKLEIEEMRGDRSRQNAALIEAAERVKRAETDIAALESRLDDLIVSEIEVRGRLDGADASIANVLAALERISHSPPPALMVDPADALGSARGALLISAILPQLTERADGVTADLNRLTEIKTAALAEEAQLRANFQILEEEQLRIATLIVARRQGEQAITAELAAEEAAAIELAERAATLKDLIEGLTQRADAVATARQATAAVNAGAATPALAPETVRLALANTNRVEPAVPFASARGYLTLPSNGVRVIEFGASDGFGGISQGISVVTRADAQVVAPADGWVLYKGEYLNYGQIVILNPGQDYTILLAGLDAVNVDIGQFVLMGQPVGTMGSRTIGRAQPAGAGAQRPTLYIELRQDNRPLDPTGWWAQPAETQIATSQNG